MYVCTEDEKLPYELGWTPPQEPTTLASLAVMVNSLLLATGEPLPEGLIISESAVANAFSGINVITGEATSLLGDLLKKRGM